MAAAAPPPRRATPSPTPALSSSPPSSPLFPRASPLPPRTNRPIAAPVPLRARSPSPRRAATAARPPPALHAPLSPRSHAYGARAPSPSPSPPPPLTLPHAAPSPASPAPPSARALTALRLVTLTLPSPEAEALAWALPPLPSEQAFHAAAAARLAAVASALAALRPDILCLQGASTHLHPALGHCTLAHYLARALRLAPAGASYSSRAVRWAYPVAQQQQPGGALPLLSCMGVATLYNAATVRHVAQVSHAAAHGESELQRGANGSAFTLDCFERRASGSAAGAGAPPPPPQPPLHVLNVHLLPAALPTAPLGEVLARAAGALRGPAPAAAPSSPWQRCAIAGSLGASAPPAARALASLLALQPHLTDLVLPEELDSAGGAPGAQGASASARGGQGWGGAGGRPSANHCTKETTARTAAALLADTAAPAFLAPPLRSERLVLGPGLACAAPLAQAQWGALAADLEL